MIEAKEDKLEIVWTEWKFSFDEMIDSQQQLLKAMKQLSSEIRRTKGDYITLDNAEKYT